MARSGTTACRLVCHECVQRAQTSALDSKEDYVSNLLEEGFVELRCCGESVGFVNARLFTPEASARFSAIQQRLGNAWVDDAATKELLKDPASYGPPSDGTPILFPCSTCGAKFAWAGGRPVQISST